MALQIDSYLHASTGTACSFVTAIIVRQLLTSLRPRYDHSLLASFRLCFDMPFQSLSWSTFVMIDSPR